VGNTFTTQGTSGGFKQQVKTYQEPQQEGGKHIFHENKILFKQILLEDYFMKHMKHGSK
jgi:hypothetical protein